MDGIGLRAQELARKIGDEEWRRGNTKYALEAYEASNISRSELFELAEKLLDAESLWKIWVRELEAANKLPKQ